MSLPAKITLFTACAGSISIVAYVHYKQQIDRSKLHEGVIKDVERQHRRKAENLYYLQQQIEITKELKKSQYSNTES